MTDELISNLTSFIKTEILRRPERNLRPDEPLLSSGLVDSFNVVELALFIEDNYGVIIEDTELTRDTFDTVQELATLVRSRMDAG